jgi:hypothetical protein
VLAQHHGSIHDRCCCNASREIAGSKNQGGAYVPPHFGGMYAPSGQGRRHAKLRHVCATREDLNKP